jgi:flagellar FliL protein
MADAVEAEIENPKNGRRTGKTIILIVVLLTLGLGGLVAGYFAANVIAADPDYLRKQNEPELVLRDGGSMATTLARITGDQPKSEFQESAYKATYYPMKEPFTSNLKNSTSFAQLSISIATYYDEQVLHNIEEHETAIRSAILLTLAEQENAALNTPQGKQMLQKILTRAINKVLKEKTGFAGAHNVYFTSLVVQ